MDDREKDGGSFIHCCTPQGLLWPALGLAKAKDNSFIPIAYQGDRSLTLKEMKDDPNV